MEDIQPPSGKHLWTTSLQNVTLSRPPFASVHFNLILPHHPFEAAYFSRGLVHSQPCQWTVCCNVPGSAFQHGFRHLSLIYHRQTDKCNLSIMLMVRSSCEMYAQHGFIQCVFYCAFVMSRPAGAKLIVTRSADEKNHRSSKLKPDSNTVDLN